jgi:hypothetical protein
VVRVKIRRTSARRNAMVVEPVQEFLLCIASAPQILRPIPGMPDRACMGPFKEGTKAPETPSYTSLPEFQAAFDRARMKPHVSEAIENITDHPEHEGAAGVWFCAKIQLK